ncbi:hypothetical protein ACLQ2Q_04020 [Microbacterium sp. DT81.1]|uniref:hypothetical protein n=1 Tax=Microbacterium sp. DT81.1 TaxID=3393413 RepID=UPI003CE6BC23
MFIASRRRLGVAALLAAAFSVAALPSAALAAEPYDAQFPAGQACSFELGLNITSGGNMVEREFTDREGNVVRTLTAGKGFGLTFTNVDTGAALSSRSNGFATRTVLNPDGSSTVTSTGHTLVILFPTDVPAGPSTTLYVGRVTYTSTATNDFTITGSSGRTIDVCRELT